MIKTKNLQLMRSNPKYFVIIGLLFALFMFTDLSFAQTNSQILLVFTDLTICDEECKNDTKGIRLSLKETLETSGLFKDVITYTAYKGEIRRKNFKKYCNENKFKYYMKSEVNNVKASTGKIKYKIDFSLFDLALFDVKDQKQGKIPNPKLTFELDTERPGASIKNIDSILNAELNYFNEHSNKFKSIITVTEFKPEGATHSNDFPEWLADKLNEALITSQTYQFQFEKEVSEQLDKNVITGSLNVVEEEDIIKVVFWLDNPSETKKGKVTITAFYTQEDDKMKRRVIEEVMKILNK